MKFTTHAKWLVVYEYRRALDKEFNTLTEAKKYAISLAKKLAWSGKLNSMVSNVVIYHRIAPTNLVEYARTYFPVRGSGASSEKILAYMKKEGIQQGKIIRYQYYKRTCARVMGKPYEHIQE
jgi:hypothetical protein